MSFSPGLVDSWVLNNATGFREIYITAEYTDLHRVIDGLASIIKFNTHLKLYEKDILFLFFDRRNYRIQGACTGGCRIPSPLQKAGAWRLLLEPYKRKGAGDHTGTISAIDAGLEIASRHPIQEIHPQDLL